MKHLSVTYPLLVIALLFGGFYTPQLAWGAGEHVSTVPAAAGQGVKSKWGDDPKQMALRLNSVNTLIEKSTGARRIAATHDPDAMALRDNARVFLHEARAAHERGENDAAKKLLSKASQAIFQAMRKADGGASGVAKEANDFKRRMESVKVLLSAHQRISKEKKQGGETNSKIQQTMAQVVKLQEGGKLAEARVKLDEAYIMAKLGIEQMRRGDTLIRSLHFESKEEEYHYEIDRNDTHQMLVSMLLSSKPEGTKMMAAKFIAKAKGIRQEAEQMAAKKKFEQAITALEKSTKELVRAIRSAGVYIPG